MDKKEKLLHILKECAKDDDTEAAHINADAALIEFIDDVAIKKAFDLVRKWYA